jgi:outer membrane protein OmpA-like peptidoglycan-associated protein
MRKDTSVPQTESQQELEQLRAVILGRDHQVITDAINEQAREIVGSVLTEAIHDRQTKDGSVNKVLLPIVESAVEHSVTHQSDRLVTSLYPLMGSLVRKSVSAFLSDFIEKTNQLIEHSFTLKGLKWRFNAWKAGVSFTQYIVSQTYNYRVEHILLIHQETGLLLKSVNLDQQSQSDADLISSMLSAINDFVGDSFQTNQDGLKEQLQTVSTDNFNLLIKPGPKAIIVAAVTGNPPQDVSENLQVTLENVHKLYRDEFEQFNGDNAPFDSSENQLRDCLLTEEKIIALNLNKKPWFAWLIITIIVMFLGFQLQGWYQLKVLNNSIMKIDQEPGIVVQSIIVNSETDIALDVMRDPNAIPIEKWFDAHKLSFRDINLKERMYRSLSPEILESRVQEILSDYPYLSPQWQDEQLLLTGNIDITSFQKITQQLADAGIFSNQLNIEKLIVNNSDNVSDSVAIQQQIFKNVVGKISATQLDFDIGNNQVTPRMKANLQQLVNQFMHLERLGKQLNINVGLLIMGSSDNSGSRKSNTKLSMDRAENTATALAYLGLNREQMFVTGLGQIDIKDVKYTSRKVMFNIMYVNNVPESFHKSRDGM